MSSLYYHQQEHHLYSNEQEQQQEQDQHVSVHTLVQSIETKNTNMSEQQQHHDNEDVEEVQQSEKKEKKMKSKSKKSKSKSRSKSQSKTITKSKKEKKSIQVEDVDDQQQQQQQASIVDPLQQKATQEKTKKKKKNSKDSTTATITSIATNEVSIIIAAEDNEEKSTNRKKKSHKNRSKKSSSNNDVATVTATAAASIHMDDIVTVPSLTLTDDMTTDNSDEKKTTKKTKKKTTKRSKSKTAKKKKKKRVNPTLIDPPGVKSCIQNDTDHDNETAISNDNETYTSNEEWITSLQSDDEEEDNPPRRQHNNNNNNKHTRRRSLSSRGYEGHFSFNDSNSNSFNNSRSNSNNNHSNNSMTLEDIEKYGYEDTTTKLLDYDDPSAKPSLGGSGRLSASQHRQRRRRSSFLRRGSSIRRLSLDLGNSFSEGMASFSSGIAAFGARLGLGRNLDRQNSNRRRLAYASQGRTDNFRITKNPHSMKIQRMEAYFYNHGMEIALYVLFVSLQLLAGFYGAYQFTEMGGYSTDDPILKITLPIARAGGRLVTLNCAILLLTACKYCWTLCRTYIAPIIPIGFPIDNVMPVYHRTVALWIIVFGLMVHTLPQIVNYSTKAIVLEPQFRMWTFGNGFATTQLLITGTLLAIIFSTFYVTTLPIFRKTAAGFRWFWFFHMGGVATAYPLLLLHGTCKGHPIFFYFALIPLLLYIFDVTMRRSKITTTKVLEWNTHDDNGEHITELVLECPKNFVYTPGQYAELKFSPISTSEWHPFTIASAPDPPPPPTTRNNTADTIEIFVDDDIEEGRSVDNDDDAIDDMESGGEGSSASNTKKLVFYIKSAGRWTDALYNYASAFDLTKAKQPTMIQLRGPHGAPAMNYFEYRHIIVIGSGIGVTPLMSIWKYLVQRGRTMLMFHNNNNNNNRKSKSPSLQGSVLTYDASTIDNSRHSVDLLLLSDNEDDNDDKDYDNFYDELNDEQAGSSKGQQQQQQQQQQKSKIRKYSIVLEKILESMTVSMILLCVFVMGETIAIILQMFGFCFSANLFGAILSSIALLVHGSNVIVSTIVVGPWIYVFLFKCWLEISILLVDSVAVWVAICGLLDEEMEATNTTYFYFFGVVVALHAIRIFHIFYTTLKPPKEYGSSSSTTTATTSSTTSTRTSTITPNNTRTSISTNKNKSKSKNQICSIQGILINKYYSGMRFAAKSLMPPTNDGGKLSKLFSMDFYGTREKPKEDDDVDHDEEALITDLMGSGEFRRISNHSSSAAKSPDDYFHSGRPDWTTIFLQAMAKAHTTNPEGETVGVFFCGAPAIAASLQSTAKKVTSQHQYATKHLDGKRCTCKLIVHTENF